MQWGIGVVVDAVRAASDADGGSALPTAFALVVVADVFACAWFALGWRRHAVVAPLALA